MILKLVRAAESRSETLKKKDIKGRTPLHVAIEKKAPDTTVFAVLDAFPKVSNSFGGFLKSEMLI